MHDNCGVFENLSPMHIARSGSLAFSDTYISIFWINQGRHKFYTCFWDFTFEFQFFDFSCKAIEVVVLLNKIAIGNSLVIFFSLAIFDDFFFTYFNRLSIIRMILSQVCWERSRSANFKIHLIRSKKNVFACLPRVKMHSFTISKFSFSHFNCSYSLLQSKVGFLHLGSQFSYRWH